MSNQTELEAALYLIRDFLQEQKRREREGVTVEAVLREVREGRAVADATKRHVEVVIKDQIATNLRLDRYGRRLRVLERAREGHSSTADDKDEGETTGNFRVIDEQRAVEIASLRARTEQLESEKKEEKASESFWRNWRAQLVAAVVMAIFVAGCTTAGGVVTYWLTGGHK